MTEYFKVITPQGEPIHGGSGAWPLPSDSEPGEWRTVEGELSACRNGLHLTTADHLRTWLATGAMVYRAEPRGPVLDAGTKCVASTVRLLPGPIAADSIVAAFDSIGWEGRTHRPTPPSPRDHYLTSQTWPRGHTLAAAAERAHKRITRQHKADQKRRRTARTAALAALAALTGTEV